MKWLLTAAALAGVILATVAATDLRAQTKDNKDNKQPTPDRRADRGKEIPGPKPGEALVSDCPNCKANVDYQSVDKSVTCPKCGKVLTVTASGLELNEVSENKWKKPLLIGGGVLLALGLLGMVLKKTVMAAPPPKKKKKKRRDEDEDDDRPRKKKTRAVVEDEDDDTPPPPKKNKPRILDEE
jgi:ribosomal protein S27E